jgi:ribosomal protein S18 acetylase RimI-like enzyme
VNAPLAKSTHPQRGRINISQISIEEDEWLAMRLGVPAFRLMNIDCISAGVLKAEISRRVPGNAFIQSRILSGQSETERTLVRLAFGQVEKLITFEAPTSMFQLCDKVRVRTAIGGDRLRVVDLARRAFSHSRFHQDPMISKDVANTIKADWVDGFFKGRRGQGMIIAEDKDQIFGFLLFIENEDRIIIDLIAVEKSVRGKGLAREMIGFAIQHTPRGIVRISAGTQSNNHPSIGLYEALGFSRKHYQLTFHKHGAVFV